MKIDQNWIEILIVDTILTLDFESDGFRRPNLLESEFELSTIGFGTPNCLTLVAIDFKTPTKKYDVLQDWN